MKHKAIKDKVLILFMIVGSLFITSSKFKQTKTNDKNRASGETVAHFEFFSYKGDDEFYKQNVLPGSDYFYNPILPGWYSDPSVCTNGEDYFMVTSTFSYFPGVPIFHSKDLVNWKQIGHVLDRTSQLPLEGQRISEGIFAPAISYNPYNETYYMVTTNIRKGNFFVKTKDPFGEWSEPVWLPDVHGIDPSFFFDDDGRAYILNNDAPEGPSLYEGHRAVKIQEFDVEKEKTFGPKKMLINGGINIEEKPIWIEGPHLYKVNGRYLLMAAEGGTGPQHSEVILYGDSPMGDFTPWEKNPILTQRHLNPDRENPVTCAGHADLIQDKDGEWWSVFLACRPIENKFENLGRETFLMPVRWSNDGFPFMTRDEESIPMIVKKEGLVRNAEITFGNFEKVDNFESETLGKEWVTLRGPAEDLYSLTDKPGSLSLKCSSVKASDTSTPAYISRRMQHHQFTCSTKMTFNPLNEKEEAGLLLFKDEAHHYFLAVGKEGKKRKVSLQKISKSGTEILASETIKGGKDAIGLKVDSKGGHYDFAYAVGNGSWKTLCQDIDARHLSTANSFGFTGTNIGMYAVKK